MNLIEPIHQQAITRPNDTALILSKKYLTWSELDELIWAQALIFSEADLMAGDQVIVAVNDPLTHLLSSLALAKIGVSHITVSTKNLVNTAIKLRKVFKLKKIITDNKKYNTASSDFYFIDNIKHRTVKKCDRESLTLNDANLPWMIFQSSGTTGGVRYAKLTHQDAVNRNNRVKEFSLGTADKFWAGSGLNFISSKRRIFEALSKGATVILSDPGPISEAHSLLLRQSGLTVGSGTPSHLHQLIKVGISIPSIRTFEVSYAPVSEELRQEFKAVINKNLYVIYGANEAGVISVANPEIQVKVKNTVGFPLDSINLEIVNEHQEPLPFNVVGEIRVKGAGVINSYINDSIATDFSFRNGWFYPGDLGYLTEEGALVLQGRKDDMMIFDGMNIYPAEIENVISAHPAVREIAAFPLRHKQFQDIPVAAVTLNKVVTEQNIIDYCKPILGIKSPKLIFILDKLPRNSSGKVLKRELSLIAIRMLKNKNVQD